MKNVLITGAGRGIGKATATLFTKNGYHVIAPTRQEMDLNSKDSIHLFLEQNKHLEVDILINNAGINPLSTLENVKEEDLEETIQVNLIAPVLLTQFFVKGMKERRFGRIVNISSIWGVVSKEGRTSYSVSKNGIHGLTNTFAVELGVYNILVNSVCPGFTNTELTKQNVSQELEKELCLNIPLARFAEPEEIAKVVFFLGSEENTYITGQKIIIDGGFTAK